MPWPTKAKRKTKKLKKTIKLIAILFIGFFIVSYAVDNDSVKDKIDDIKDDGDKIKDVDSGSFDISFDKDCKGDIREINIKI